jgi:glutathione S-transferase
MKLLGSATSPYVRRIRLLLDNRDYEFANLDIYGADRDALRRHNPALKIPTLIDGDNTLFDSRVIARYLGDKLGYDPLTWEQENQLTVIDGANDSAVILALSRRSGIDTAADVMFYNLQHERIQTCIAWLSEQAAAGAFNDWHYPAICVYCLVDWAEMRGLFDFDSYRPLLDMRETHRGQAMVAETDPRAAA